MLCGAALTTDTHAPLHSRSPCVEVGQALRRRRLLRGRQGDGRAGCCCCGGTAAATTVVIVVEQVDDVLFRGRGRTPPRWRFSCTCGEGKYATQRRRAGHGCEARAAVHRRHEPAVVGFSASSPGRRRLLPAHGDGVRRDSRARTTRTMRRRRASATSSTALTTTRASAAAHPFPASSYRRRDHATQSRRCPSRRWRSALARAARRPQLRNSGRGGCGRRASAAVIGGVPLIVRPTETRTRADERGNVLTHWTPPSSAAARRGGAAAAPLIPPRGRV